MAKKNFQSAPKPQKQPTPEQITAFEQGGAGHDERPQTHIPTNKGKSANDKKPKIEEPLKRLSVDLPQSEHSRFKTACSATRKTMVAEVISFIKKRTRQLEEEAGITRK